MRWLFNRFQPPPTEPPRGLPDHDPRYHDAANRITRLQGWLYQTNRTQRDLEQLRTGQPPKHPPEDG